MSDTKVGLGLGEQIQRAARDMYEVDEAAGIYFVPGVIVKLDGGYRITAELWVPDDLVPLDKYYVEARGQTSVLEKTGYEGVRFFVGGQVPTIYEGYDAAVEVSSTMNELAPNGLAFFTHHLKEEV